MGLLVVTSFAVFVNVETFFLNSFVDAQTVQFLDAIEQGESAGSCPEVDNEDAEALCAEESDPLCW